ncbi:MAG TPA: YiiX/YebB-like N1pC/P60 family cysteine hydrolase [Candidatus Saccharimonadia bacterium]|nr:YiiX/YebB-like N1pC/P60 family cysteine hydrolase [Candidatus Saccharimonadia bacterium]
MVSLMRFVGRRLARFLSKPRDHLAHLPTSRRDRVAATLRKGDVLLVEGTSRFAGTIKYLTQSTWSHAALYIGDHLGPPPAGEAARVLVDVDVNDGVRLIPLSAFSNLHTRICRPVGLSDEEIGSLVDFMVSRVGYSYDLRNVFDLARYLVRAPPLPGSMKRRMIALGSGEPTRAICSTLLAQAFEAIHYPILPEIQLFESNAPGAEEARAELLHIRHYSLYTPRDFDVSPFFRIVKPRLEDPFDFRKLTWSDAEAPGWTAVE